MKILGERWRDMSMEDKKIFNILSGDDKVRYKNECAMSMNN
jgi:hypothetical protein